MGSSRISAWTPISANCSCTMKRYVVLVMTTGRSNNAASETRKSVSWNVDRGPNNGRNCFGCTSRDAGHSRVPAPPHMISGIIRLSIEPRISFATDGCDIRTPCPGLFSRRHEGAAIPVCTLLPDRRQKHTKTDKVRNDRRICVSSLSNLTSADDMRRILLSALKILVSAALLYFALRKINFYDLASRFDVASLGWIGVAIAVTFLQIFLGALRWRVISVHCGAPLATTQAFRFNMIGMFFNQTLPSSIGGDAVRLWLVARGGAGWRAATYSIFVDRAIGLIALAIVIVASLPWSYRLIDDPHGRSALLFVDFAALAGGLGFLLLGRLPWPWLKHWWGTHHIHACSVIANRVLFGRVHGPKVAVLSLLVHVLAVVIAWCVVQSI